VDLLERINTFKRVEEFSFNIDEVNDLNDLKLIDATGLIKIYVTDKGEPVVDLRELHEGVSSKQEFANWVKQRLNEVDAIENVDYSTFDNFIKREESNLGTKRKDYIAKLDTAKEMAMLERNEKGKQYRRYLIEVEKRYTAQPKVSLNEFDQVTKLLQMLQTGNKDGLFNQATERALRLQIAETIAGKQPALQQRPEGRGIRDIANSLEITFQKAVALVKKHNLKRPMFGSFYSYDYKGQPKEIFLYNRSGEEFLRQILAKEIDSL